MLQLGENSLGTGETAGAGAAAAAAFLDRPLQRGLDRRRGGVDVVSVKAEPGLQSQAVAGTEPDRPDLVMAEQRCREGFGMFGRDRNLKAILAGVAGARDKTIDAVDAAETRIHEAHRGRLCTIFRQHRFGLGPLQRDQRAVGERFDLADVRQAGAQTRLIRRLAGSVDHQEQMVAEIRHHQVVENAAVAGGELGIALPARGYRHDILRYQPFQRQRGILDPAGFRAQRDLAHMRDIEQAGGHAGVQVFPEHAGGILHRHGITRERHHPAAAARMEPVQGGVFQCRFGVARKHRGPSRSVGNQLPERPVEAPSVAVPESIIPSADASGTKPLGVSFQMSSRRAVRLPESFRGGCSFGAGAKAGLSRRDSLKQIGTEHGGAKPVNAAAASIHDLVLMRQVPDPLHTFWTPPPPLSKKRLRRNPDRFAIGWT